MVITLSYTSGKLTIELDDIYAKINLTLRTIEGKIISSNDITFNNTITLEIKEKPGIYIIEISNNEDKSARLRVIKY